MPAKGQPREGRRVPRSRLRAGHRALQIRVVPLAQRDVKPDWRQTLLAVAGIISALAVGAGLIVTNSANRAQQRLVEQGQVTDRFGRAIDQIGSDKLDVRLGGIYALERLANDSPADEDNIIDVLGAFVRTHAGKKPDTLPAKTDVSGPAVDVHAAVTVLARRPEPLGYHQVDLSNTDLDQAKLQDANFNYANLSLSTWRSADLLGADLIRADLGSADLANAQMNDADLSGAEMIGTNLSYAQLQGAKFEGALMQEANFTSASLFHAVLTGTSMYGANLTKADLSGANLTRQYLEDSDFTGATLQDADLRGALLREARGLSFEQINCSWIDSSTELPPTIARPVEAAPETTECGG